MAQDSSNNKQNGGLQNSNEGYQPTIVIPSEPTHKAGYQPETGQQKPQPSPPPKEK